VCSLNSVKGQHAETISTNGRSGAPCRPSNDPFQHNGPRLGDGCAACHEVADFPGCRGAHRGPARGAALLAGRPQPILRALGDQPSLKVGDGTKDMKHQLAGGRVGVDPLLEADPMDAPALQARDGIDQRVDYG